jgi:hypothetical protein
LIDSSLKVSFGESENLLVADVLYAIQGINGRFVHLTGQLGDADITIDAQVRACWLGLQKAPITCPVRNLMARLSELGHLVRQAQHVLALPGAPGLVVQSCRSAIQREFSEFLRLVAILEAQVI